MAVDEDHPTIQEQPEQDGTQKNQKQQKEEEEDSEEEDSEEEYDLVYDLEYLYELLRPFTMKQMRTLSEKAVEKHPVLAESWRKAEAFLKRYEVEEEEEEDEEPFDSSGCLETFVKKCVNKFPDVAEIVHEQADMNPAHRKILVWSHGFRWDATPESLTLAFGKYGEIEDCEYVTDKHTGKFKCCAFILFKHWNGARKALEQPLMKIGNRMTVCNLALFGVYNCRYLEDYNPGLPQQRVQASSRSELFLPPSLIMAPVACHNEPVMKFVWAKCCCWSSHSLHGSLDHFLEMDRVRKTKEKPDAISNAVVSYNPLVDPTVSKQFEWVCKSSSQLLEKPPINSKHTSLLLRVTVCWSYLLSCEKFEIGARLYFPPQFPRAILRFMGSSVNGILGLYSGTDKVVLWNPSTKEIKIVPPSPVEFESPYRKPQMDYHGFGYDSAGHDYKVIRYVEFFGPYAGPYHFKNVSLEPLWEIYSLRRDSWKELSYKMPSSYLSLGCPGLCTGGVCHWLGGENKSLVSFDLSKEMFLETPIPSYTCGVKVEMRLTEINGYVALISNYQAKNTIEVSILNKFGVNSWTKLFDIGPLPRVVNLSGAGKDGYIFFYNEDDGLACFDFSTLLIVRLGLKRRCGVVTYKENLESLISFGFEKYDDEAI